MLAIDIPCWKGDRQLPWPDAAPAVARGFSHGAAVILTSFVGNPENAPFIYFRF